MSLHSVLIKNLGSEYAKEHNIKGGNSGIKIICYSYDSSTIQAAAEYSVKNPFDIFGIGYIKVVQEFTYEVWLGEKYAGDYGKDKDNYIYSVHVKHYIKLHLLPILFDKSASYRLLP